MKKKKSNEEDEIIIHDPRLLTKEDIDKFNELQKHLFEVNGFAEWTCGEDKKEEK